MNNNTKFNVYKYATLTLLKKKFVAFKYFERNINTFNEKN